jgi:hypothetical protein
MLRVIGKQQQGGTGQITSAGSGYREVWLMA